MLYCCARAEKVRVIGANGQPRYFCAPITIRDLLRQYRERYCVRDVSGEILSMEAQLQGGNTYLLLSLPRLSPKGKPVSNWPPCERSSPWQPSLDMISENKTLSQRKKGKQPVKREKEKNPKPV